MTQTETTAMRTDDHLPKFRQPPLTEVVHGVQFRALPMTIVHPGLFYARIKERYPRTQTVAPLPPLPVTLNATGYLQFGLSLVNASELPRAWFVSEDDTLVVQLQPDRLLLNWKRANDAADYPHFDKVSQEFQRVYKEFEIFATEVGLGLVEPNQCEMAYINRLYPPAPGAARPDLACLVRIWSGDAGPEWDLPQQDIAFSVDYILPNPEGDPEGRLKVALSTLGVPGKTDRQLQLDISAHGRPRGDGLDGVVAFHEIAHANIVRCFTGITTSAAHEKWGRSQ